MTQVWERLFIGGIADAEELAEGNPHPISMVVSLSEVAVRTRREDVKYVHLPIEDDKPVPVRQFYCIIDAIRKNIRWGTVLLHCGQGVSRAPSLAAAYMDAVGFKNVDAALKEIKQLRSFIHPSTELVESLKENLR